VNKTLLLAFPSDDISQNGRILLIVQGLRDPSPSVPSWTCEANHVSFLNMAPASQRDR